MPQDARPQVSPESLCVACPLNCGVNDPNRATCASADLGVRLDHALRAADEAIEAAAEERDA